jgi:hypothetical protein
MEVGKLAKIKINIRLAYSKEIVTKKRAQTVVCSCNITTHATRLIKPLIIRQIAVARLVKT